MFSAYSSKKFTRVFLTALLFLFLNPLNAQPPLLRIPAYVNNYAEAAVSEMTKHKIPASVILAQAIFESNCGASDLAKRSNNHFGIKCHIEWGGDTIVKNDDTLNECFRRYHNVEDSYSDHSMFLKSRSRYSVLFRLKPTDYKGWCKGLKAAGYATYRQYAEELIKIIEENGLNEIDGPEKMISGKLFCKEPEEIKPSDLSIENFSAEEILQNDAIFMDEHEVLIQSLEMMMTSDDEDIADTP